MEVRSGWHTLPLTRLANFVEEMLAMIGYYDASLASEEQSLRSIYRKGECNMVSKQTTIINATGLHARPASVFVSEAKKYESNVTIKDLDKGTAPVSAKSIMMILAAGLGTGAKVEIACDGPDEQEALDALVALVDSGFGE